MKHALITLCLLVAAFTAKGDIMATPSNEVILVGESAQQLEKLIAAYSSEKKPLSALVRIHCNFEQCLIDVHGEAKK